MLSFFPRGVLDEILNLIESVSEDFSSYSFITIHIKGWLVGYFGFNGHLRQYFSLYRAVSQREGEKGERIDESKNVQTTPTRTYCKRNRPLPYCNQNCRTPRHWKFTQHHRTTRPSPHIKGVGKISTLGRRFFMFFFHNIYFTYKIKAFFSLVIFIIQTKVKMHPGTTPQRGVSSHGQKSLYFHFYFSSNL